MHSSSLYNDQGLESLSMGYILSATRSVASLAQKEEMFELTHGEEEYLMAMVLLLVLHDVCFLAALSFERVC